MPFTRKGPDAHGVRALRFDRQAMMSLMYQLVPTAIGAV